MDQETKRGFGIILGECECMMADVGGGPFGDLTTAEREAVRRAMRWLADHSPTAKAPKR